MKNDEFAFFNQQLAAMLRENIPLEGALRQLCANMRRGELRSELEQLEADLGRGTPLPTAIAARKLPKFYVQMVQVGVAGNDLPGMLVMLADYYQRANLIWTRLKGILVYPLLVLVAAFSLSAFITFLGLRIIRDFEPTGFNLPPPDFLLISLWAPPVLTGALIVTVLLILAVPGLRQNFRWRLPAFKEANLSQVAGALGLMLRNGGNLGDGLKVVRQLESGTAAGRELEEWHQRLADGRGKFSELAHPGVAFPPMFIWLVSNSGEDLAGGFQRAAEIYGARAAHRVEMLLYAVLPFSVVILGTMIVGQVFPVIKLITTFVQMLDGVGGGVGD